MSNKIKWIKLSIDVFDDEKFDAIRTLPDANDIQLVWVKLLCLAGKCNESGFLMLTSEIPYTDEMLANKFKMEIGVVQRSLSLFQKLNMVDLIDNVYMVSNWTKYQSLDAYEKKKEYDRAYQAKRYAEKKQLLEDKKNSRTRVKREKERESYDSSLSSSNIFSSNNSNVVNLNNVVNDDKNKDEYIIYILNNKDLLDSLIEWMEYKDNKKPRTSNHYDTESGIRKVIKLAVEHSIDYGPAEVIRAIDTAIAGGWMGIKYTDLERYGKKVAPNKPQPKPKPQEEPASEPEMTDEEWLRMMEETYGKDV